MSISTRLILILMVVVGAVMGAAGYFLLRQQERALLAQMRNEVRAHALTLQIALGSDYGAGRISDAQELIDRLSENTEIHGVVLFDASGEVLMTSDPLVADEIEAPPEVARVIASGETVETFRRSGDRQFFFIIMPIEARGERRGAFEIIQETSAVEADIAGAQRAVAVTTLLLVATVFLVVFVVMRRTLTRPINELLAGAEAVGRGDLAYRVREPREGNEFARLAREFNRMADSLEERRVQLVREAEERLALEREVRHHERLALAGHLAAGVAHELGAPLNVIDARAEQLLSRPEAPLPTRQRNLTIIRSQTERITRIVRQLLNLARPHDMCRQPVNVTSVVDSVLELVEADAERAGVTIELASATDATVAADRDMLHQVLLNVCLNALQAMPGGGTLRVEIGEGGDECVLIRVVDSGTGISEEDLHRIFDPFFTTKEVGRGTGLGLTVSKRIVEEHGGRIEASNNPERGATIAIRLPAGEESPGATENAHEHSEPSAAARR